MKLQLLFCENKTSLLYKKYLLSQVVCIVKATSVVKLALQDSDAYILKTGVERLLCGLLKHTLRLFLSD
jgi:hypothetical protein